MNEHLIDAPGSDVQVTRIIAFADTPVEICWITRDGAVVLCQRLTMLDAIPH